MQFYVQVLGYQDLLLYSVMIGISIKVMLMIVDEVICNVVVVLGNLQSVMMLIDIQDGNIVLGQVVLNVLVIQQCNIVIKMMIDEGKSFLIVGFNDDEVWLNKSGVFWLFDILLIGNLFKYIDKLGNYMEWFYLLMLWVVMSVLMYVLDGLLVNLGVDGLVNQEGMLMYCLLDNDVMVLLMLKLLFGMKFGLFVLLLLKDMVVLQFVVMIVGVVMYVDEYY